MTRRHFLTTTLGLATTTALYSWQIEPYWLDFERLDMPIKNLPPHLEGKTLMQISDIHVGNRFDYGFISESFRRARELEPDYVVYTGDYVSYEDKEQFTQLAEVLKSTVRGKLGTAGVLGNHDYGHGWAMPEVANRIASQLTDAGVTVLRNEAIDLNGLQIYGFDDLWGLRPPSPSTLHRRAAAQNHLVLSHNPDSCDLNIWNGYQGWILSGHTHGGQCKPPFLPPPVLPVKNERYTAGHIPLADGRQLYINRALGHLWPLRFNVRPEITVFTLRTA